MSGRNKEIFYNERCDATGKIKYLSKKLAKIALRRMRSKVPDTKKKSVLALVVYRCSSCTGHHIGTGTVNGEKVTRQKHRDIFKRTHPGK